MSLERRFELQMYFVFNIELYKKCEKMAMVPLTSGKMNNWDIFGKISMKLYEIVVAFFPAVHLAQNLLKCSLVQKLAFIST